MFVCACADCIGILSMTTFDDDELLPCRIATPYFDQIRSMDYYWFALELLRRETGIDAATVLKNKINNILMQYNLK